MDSKSIQEFQELYKSQTGIAIGSEVAEDKASKLIKMVKILMKEIKNMETKNEK